MNKQYILLLLILLLTTFVSTREDFTDRVFTKYSSEKYFNQPLLLNNTCVSHAGYSNSFEKQYNTNNMSELEKYKSTFEKYTRPQPLYTTTLLASKLNLR
jgi:hypothetical protein